MSAKNCLFAVLAPLSRQWNSLHAVRLLSIGTKFSIDGAGAVDCNSRRDVGPTKTIRGVYMTELNRLHRLAALSAIREWSF